MANKSTSKKSKLSDGALYIKNNFDATMHQPYATYKDFKVVKEELADLKDMLKSAIRKMDK